MAQHERRVVRSQAGLVQHHRVEAAKELAVHHARVFNELHCCRQLQALQQGHGCVADELREPGVEGAHFDRAARSEQALLQLAQGLGQRLRGRLIKATLAQGQHARVVRRGGAGPLTQPVVQALAHFARSLAREGDGQHLLRQRAGQQSTHDARDQHPRLASTRAGFHHHRPRRVAGQCVEVRVVDGAAVDGVGGRAHVGTHASSHDTGSQWSRRHRPRISQ